MNHREVYGLLKEIVLAEAPQRFSFLDVACGDASASAAMLQGTSINHYHGIDLSRPSLDLAVATLTSLPCKVDLYCRNFVEALDEWNVPVDVVWIGLSLHHLQSRKKQRFMVDVRSALASSGVFLIWEPTLLDGEDRAGWLARFSTFRPQWAALSSEEFADMEMTCSRPIFLRPPKIGRRWVFGQDFVRPRKSMRCQTGWGGCSNSRTEGELGGWRVRSVGGRATILAGLSPL